MIPSSSSFSSSPPSPLRFFPCSSHAKTLNPSKFPPLPLPLNMKDRTPSPYGAVYVPPHHRHRLRSVIVAASTGNSINSAAAVSPPHFQLDSKHALENQRNTFTNSKNDNKAFPYLPPHRFQEQQRQLQKKSSVDGGSSEGSDREIELSFPPGAHVSDNIDAWKRKLITLKSNNDKQEIISREKNDRREYEQIAELASKLGLYSHLYAKVVVVSKDPLPNYRFDLDDKRPQREVVLPPGLQRQVHSYLVDYVSQKPRGMDVFSRSSSDGSIVTDEGLFELPEPSLHSKIVLEKIVRRRSLQMCTEQLTWQESPEGQKILELRKALPAYKEKDAILSVVIKFSNLGFCQNLVVQDDP